MILVTGGAGYIGSHIVRTLDSAVVVDDLSMGHEEFVSGVPLVEMSVLDTESLVDVMKDFKVDAVIHLAGMKAAGLSVKFPLFTYEQNVEGTLSVLKAMKKTGVNTLVFSSSAAVYGTPTEPIVYEESMTRPVSPYGESKLMAEKIIASCPLRHTSLRYFNVVGSASPDLYDSSLNNLFPIIIDALRKGETPTIFGNDYPTVDGTCVRDYVHVEDVAQAHVIALNKLLNGNAVERVYNLGSGTGYSVSQIMQKFSEISGIDFDPKIEGRRIGDPAKIVASIHRAQRDLNWKTQNLESMISSALAAGIERQLKVSNTAGIVKVSF